VKPFIQSAIDGENVCIFAYGQTGSGKTFTMEGFTYNSTDNQRGIIPRSIEEIFNYIESFSSHETKFMVRASYLQIYNESISDLLKDFLENINQVIRANGTYIPKVKMMDHLMEKKKLNKALILAPPSYLNSPFILNDLSYMIFELISKTLKNLIYYLVL
jgi:arsenate reductase-like glutaredoxin family protein